MIHDNKALKTLYVFNGLFVLAGSLLGPLYAVYVEGITKGVFPISLSWSVYLFSATFFTYLMSKGGDRVKEKEYLLMAGFLVRAVCWVSYIFIGNFYFLLLIQFLLGIGDALGTPAFDAIFAEHLDGGNHIRDYADWGIVRNICIALGTLIGGMIVQVFGFNLMFLFMALLAIASFVGILLKPRKLL